MTSISDDVLFFIRRYACLPAPEADFRALALKVFRFQFKHNRFYRRYCEMEGASPHEVRDWRHIPAMPALAFKEFALTTFPLHQKIRAFKTSGTSTGSVSGSERGVHYFKTLKLYEQSIQPPFGRYVANRPFSYYFLMPTAGQAPHSSLSYMMKVVNTRFAKGSGKFYVRPQGPDFRALSLDLGRERKPVLLLSTAFALKAFLDYLKSCKIELALPKGSRLMETGGFKGRTVEVPKRTLYRLCAQKLGIPLRECVSEYGMTELSSQYYSKNEGLFRGPAWMRTQVMDPVTGKECVRGRVGLLKHVDLSNVGSVMAVQTEDLGRQAAGGFEFVGRAKGSQARGCSLTYERFLKEA